MPHLTLEYTDNLKEFDPAAALLAMNRVLLASGQFEEQDLKSRAIRLDNYRIGTTEVPRAFVHVALAMLEGRSPGVRRQVAADLLHALRQSGGWPAGIEVQCSVDVQEMVRTCYAKASLGPA